MSGKLPRVWFDIIILGVAAIAGGSFAAHRYWPIGCSNRDILGRAKEVVQRQLAADRVTFHLVEKTSRTQRELKCVATARVEFNTRASEYRDVEYRALINDARQIADVETTVKPPRE